MKLAKDCCTHPTGAETVLKRYKTESGVVLEDCACPFCDHTWTRWAGATGEFV